MQGLMGVADEKINEETYSLIYSSLKHPIRRKILRMLDGCELTFSAILEALSIDSGHLSYYLDNLGDLIVRTAEGKYGLSNFGLAAVKLMTGVEDNPEIIKVSKRKLLKYVKVFSIVLAVTLLLVASLYAMNLTASDQSNVASYPNISLALAPNGTFTYPVEFMYSGRQGQGSASSSIDGIKVYAPNTNSQLEWAKYNLFLTLDAPSQSSYTLQVTLHDREDNIIYSHNYANAASSKITLITDPITNLESYRLEIRNTDSIPLNQTLDIVVHERRFQKPLFYFGLIGIIATVTSAVILCIRWLRVKRKQAPNQNPALQTPNS